nr:hypothetical protein [uncultured Desulfobacter sp.]
MRDVAKEIIERYYDLIKEKIDQLEVGDKFVVSGLMGDDWPNIDCDPKMFGRYFFEAHKDGYFENIKYLGIKSTGRNNEYQKIG